MHPLQYLSVAYVIALAMHLIQHDTCTVCHFCWVSLARVVWDLDLVEFIVVIHDRQNFWCAAVVTVPYAMLVINVVERFYSHIVSAWSMDKCLDDIALRPHYGTNIQDQVYTANIR